MAVCRDCQIVDIGQYIGEGFNYPRLDTMMLATPIAWEGNVEQYSGRLQRDYEGKQNVIIYDYVDIHIKVFERMYHKRMRAYKKIGYNIILNIKEMKQKTNAIFDATSYKKVYETDLLRAYSEIVISSPGINVAKVKWFLNLVLEKQEQGVKISVLTIAPDEYPESRRNITKTLLEELRSSGIYVIAGTDIHEHFAIIDKEILWYGSMNMLSREKEDDNLIRIESKEIAEELLEATFCY